MSGSATPPWTRRRSSRTAPARRSPSTRTTATAFPPARPVFIPRLYNGKNRTFWFVAYEANKFGNPDSGGNITSTVPTAKMHQGDFSEFLALGSTYQIYDPRSTRLAPTAATCARRFRATSFRTSQLDPVGLNLMNLYPLPNQPGTSDFQNNFYRSGKALEDYWAFIGRIDHAFSENHRVFLRLHRDYWQEDKNRNFNNDVNGVILNRNNKGIAFDDVYVFNPSFLFNFRYGLTYQDFPERRASQGYDLSKLGFSQQLISLVAMKDKATIPNVTGLPFTALAAWETGDGVTASNTNSFVGNFTNLHGNHTFRFGPEFRVYRESRNRYQSMLSPQLTYSATYMRANDTASNPTRGGEAAAMLMGIPGGSMGISDSYVEQDKYFALYFADDWKVTKKLTLNLGLRYEYESPMTERFDRAAIHFAGTRRTR